MIDILLTTPMVDGQILLYLRGASHASLRDF